MRSGYTKVASWRMRKGALLRPYGTILTTLLRRSTLDNLGLFGVSL